MGTTLSGLYILQFSPYFLLQHALWFFVGLIACTSYVWLLHSTFPFAWKLLYFPRRILFKMEPRHLRRYRKFYIPSSWHKHQGLEQAGCSVLWGSRRNQWADCYSKWDTNAFVLLFLVLRVVILLVMYCGSHPRSLEITEKAPIDFSNSFIRLSTHKGAVVQFCCCWGFQHNQTPPALRYVYLLSLCK